VYLKDEKFVLAMIVRGRGGDGLGGEKVCSQGESYI
jgi:hypothetical protein